METGLIVLSGSSGRVEHERAALFAAQGIAARPLRWFGGPGQPPGICEVSLETFTVAVDELVSQGVQRIGVLGVSKGAEAALVTAVRDPRIDVVVAISPTAYVWSNVGDGFDGRNRPFRSSWTWQNQPLPFVPMDESWNGGPEPVALRGWYEVSERTYAALLPAASIAVETMRADLVLVAGGDDQMWPSLPYATRLAERRPSATLITHPQAGHRPRFPGEAPAASSARFRYGGTPIADALLGAQAWPVILAALSG